MSKRVRISVEVLAPAFAAVALLAAVSYAAKLRFATEALRRTTSGHAVTGEPHRPGAVVPHPTRVAAWTRPERATDASAWLYDLFTPPLLSFDPATARVVRAESSAGWGDAVPSPGLELIEVRRELFPLQLVGCLGDPADLVAIFAVMGSSETVLARAGDRLGGFGQEVVRVERRRAAPSNADSPLEEEAIVAVLRDLSTGTEVELDHRSRAYTGALSAVVGFAGESADREVRVGEVLRLGSERVRIAQITQEPPTVEVELTSDTRPLPEHRVLRRRAPQPTANAAPAAR